MSEVFFSENEEELVRLYRGEPLLPYPFPWSSRRIAYAAVPELAAVDNGELRVEKYPHRWDIPASVRDFTEPSFRAWQLAIGRAEFYEGNNARCLDITAESPATLRIQKVRYEDYARTNLMLDHRIGDRQSLRQLLHPAGQLEKFLHSSLGNNIGVNVLLVNPAGEVPLQVRSERVAIRPGQICSSSSGTFQYDDVPDGGAALKDCRLLRETEEEIGETFVSRLVRQPIVLGVARELARGGQAEIFLAAEGNFCRDDVEHALAAMHGGETASLSFASFGGAAGVFQAGHIQRALDDLEARHPGGISAPLRANISLWLKALHDDGRLRR